MKWTQNFPNLSNLVPKDKFKTINVYLENKKAFKSVI